MAGQEGWRFSPAEAVRLLERLGLTRLTNVAIENPVAAPVPLLHALLDRIEELEVAVATFAPAPDATTEQLVRRWLEKRAQTTNARLQSG